MDVNQVFSSSYTKDVPMRDIFHQANQILSGRGKKIIIREKGEDATCVTNVKKSFIFLAQPVATSSDPAAPVVNIKKSFDSVTRCEKFTFKVRGYFFINHNRQLVRMNYSHRLQITLRWKSKVLSPKKSVTLA